MAAAPDLATLFSFEPQIEGAVATILTAASVPVCRQRSQTTLSTPRVEAKLHMGTPTGHRYAPPGAVASPSQTYPDAWNAQLVLSVLTNRTVVTGNADRHDELVAKCRLAMLPAGSALNAALDYLFVQSFMDAGVIPGVHADERLDVSPLVFNLQFWILSGAWPVSVTG